MEKLLAILMEAAPRQRHLLNFLGIVAGLVASAALTLIAWGGFRGYDTALNAGATLLPAALLLAFAYGVAREIARSASRQTVQKLRETRFDEVRQRWHAGMELHFPSVGSQRTLDVDLYDRHLIPKDVSAPERKAFRECWRTTVVPEDGAFFVTYTPVGSASPQHPTGEQAVMISIWQYGNTARIGVFLQPRLLGMQEQNAEFGELIACIRGLFLSPKREIVRVDRHELILLEQVFRSEKLLTDVFFWDFAATQVAHLGAHIAIHLIKGQGGEINGSTVATAAAAPAETAHPRPQIQSGAR